MRESPYVGPPTPELDVAWRDLMGNMSIRVTNAELKHTGQKSVELPQGGYLAWLGVFHELHCIVSKPLFPLHPRTRSKERNAVEAHRKLERADRNEESALSTQLSRLLPPKPYNAGGNGLASARGPLH